MGNSVSVTFDSNSDLDGGALINYYPNNILNDEQQKDLEHFYTTTSAYFTFESKGDVLSHDLNDGQYLVVSVNNIYGIKNYHTEYVKPVTGDRYYSISPGSSILYRR
jgi:hypothetical protein